MEALDIEVLLIEDNPNDAELAMRALKKNNLLNKVIHLTDGAEALDYIFCEGAYLGEKPAVNPRVVLLDLKMPKVNGIEVLRRLKSDPSTKHIPVVVLTSSKENPDVEICYSIGVNSYIVKPIVIEDFVKVVSDLGLYWTLHNQTPD